MPSSRRDVKNIALVEILALKRCGDLFVAVLNQEATLRNHERFILHEMSMEAASAAFVKHKRFAAIRIRIRIAKFITPNFFNSESFQWNNSCSSHVNLECKT